MKVQQPKKPKTVQWADEHIRKDVCQATTSTASTQIESSLAITRDYDDLSCLSPS